MIRRAISWAGRRLGAASGGPVHAGTTAMLSPLKHLRIARPGRPLGELLTAEAEDPASEFERLLATHGAGADPDQLAGACRRQAGTWLGGGTLLGLAMLMLILAAGLTWIAGIVPLLVICAFCLRAMHSDFLAWRLERRSWDAPASYLRRLPLVVIR